VAAEPGEHRKGRNLCPTGDNLEKKEIPFHPFLLLSNPAILSGSTLILKYVKLNGDSIFCYLAKIRRFQRLRERPEVPEKV